jgi:3-hydroxyisobutyrate dehydrogenase
VSGVAGGAEDDRSRKASEGKQESIGFIGLGVMGAAMAGHLQAAGQKLFVSNRTRAKAEPLLAKGAVYCDTPAEVAQRSSIVFTIVGMPADVEEVYLGPRGLLHGAQARSLWVDMTTSSPALARRIFREARERGVGSLDAPVSGGDIGAREARLSIMVGGEAEDFERALPLLSLLGKTISHQGPAGAGQHTKLANQVAIAGAMLGVCEALGYAQKAGLDPEKVLQSIGTGAAGSWSLQHLAPRMLAGNFAPGFFVKHFAKDLALALESGAELSARTPTAALANSLYGELIQHGGAEQGTQALFRLFASERKA